MLLLITGVHGAIGSCVAEQALNRGYSVAGIGRGTVAKASANFLSVCGEVDHNGLEKICNMAGKPDVVLHLAGGSLVGNSIRNPATDFDKTVVSAHAVFEWVRTCCPEARVVVASSAAVYGENHGNPVPETAAVLPTSPYGTHKLMVELLAQSYGRQYGVSMAVVRLFSVYGTGLRKQLIWDLAQQVLSGKDKILLGGTGLETRDFVSIGDAADILLSAIKLADASVPVVNGCTGVATTVAELAHLVTGYLGAGHVTFSGQSRPGDPVSLVGDATFAAQHGIVAQTPLHRGLQHTLDWIAEDFRQSSGLVK